MRAGWLIDLGENTGIAKSFSKGLFITKRYLDLNDSSTVTTKGRTHSRMYSCLSTQRRVLWLYVQPHINSILDCPCYSTESHCSPHCSQHCIHMLISTTRPLCCSANWERRFKMYPKGSGWDNRGPCSAAVAAPLLAWWRGAQGLLMEESFRFQKDFFFFCCFSKPLDRGNTVVCVCVYVYLCAVCVYHSISHRTTAVHRVPSGVCFSHPSWKRRAACSVLVTTWSCMTAQQSACCLNASACVYMMWKCLYRSGE